MRTLLIDNYDSFTYNLFHQLTEAGGREPEVVRNDDPRWNARLLTDFDNVVVSPGPGTPLEARDLGISREILATTQLPALGICLGHQAIGALHGATVGRAPPCTGGSPAYGTTGRACSPGCRRRWRSCATTRWRSPTCRPSWRPRPGRRTGS